MSRLRRGFTLVEVLVVVGIVTLLIAMLMPALVRARDQANAIHCASNLRQIGQGMALYIGDYKGTLPLSLNLHTNPDASLQEPWPMWTWEWKLNPYLMKTAPPQTPTTAQFDLITYGGVYQCPGKPDWDILGTGVQQNSYAMNAFASTPLDSDTTTALVSVQIFPWVKIVQLIQSERRLLVADADEGQCRILTNGTMYTTAPALWHNSPSNVAHGGYDNVLFCDMHVEPVFKNGLTYPLWKK